MRCISPAVRKQAAAGDHLPSAACCLPASLPSSLFPRGHGWLASSSDCAAPLAPRPHPHTHCPPTPPGSSRALRLRCWPAWRLSGRPSTSRSSTTGGGRGVAKAWGDFEVEWGLRVGTSRVPIWELTNQKKQPTLRHATSSAALCLPVLAGCRMKRADPRWSCQAELGESQVCPLALQLHWTERLMSETSHLRDPTTGWLP